MSIHVRQTTRGPRYDVRYRDDAGKVHTKTKRTLAEAKTFERAELTARDRGTWVDPKERARTFADLAAAWLESNPAKRDTTADRDEIALRLHILPTLGAKPMASITPDDVQKLVNAWSKKMKPRSARRTYGVLHAVMAQAVERDTIGRTPCRGIRLPATEPLRRKLPTVTELATVAAGMGDLGAMVWIGVATGLRWGEVAGLRVGRVNFLEGRLEVVEQVTRSRGGGPATGAPKSEAGRRTMAIPRALLELVTDQLAARGLTGVDADAFLFVSPKGSMLDYSHWRRRVWQPACVAAGVGAWVREDGKPWETRADGKRLYLGLGFHDLRRVNASALVAEGVDLKTAQTRLGHSDPRLTIGLYAQALSELDVDAADRLGERLLPKAARDGRAMLQA